MRQVLGEAELYFGGAAFLTLLNLAWARMCFELLSLHVEKKYRGDLSGTEFEYRRRPRAFLFALGLFFLLLVASFSVGLIARSVANHLQSVPLAVLVAAVAAALYFQIPRVFVSRLELVVEGLDSPIWEDALVAPPRTASMVLYLRPARREWYAAAVVLSFAQAFALRFPATFDLRSRAAPLPVTEGWRALVVMGFPLLTYVVFRTSARLYLSLRPEMFIFYRALNGAVRAVVERRELAKQSSSDDGADGPVVAAGQDYKFFVPGEWRGERHSEIFSLARSIARAPRRFRRRFTRAQVEKIDGAARILCSTLLAGSVHRSSQDDVIARCLPYAVSLMFHRDPVFVAEQIRRNFVVENVDVKIGGRGVAGALGTFNEMVKTVGPLVRFLGLVAVATVLAALGRTPEVLDFVKKLLGG